MVVQSNLRSCSVVVSNLRSRYVAYCVVRNVSFYFWLNSLGIKSSESSTISRTLDLGIFRLRVFILLLATELRFFLCNGLFNVSSVNGVLT
jgi:hypothetical protein